MHLVATAIALGVAGFDPLGALSLVAAMAMGARRRAVAVMTASILGTTLLVGVVPALVAGSEAQHLVDLLGRLGHRVGSAALGVVGLALLAWGLWRLLHPSAHDDQETARVRSVTSSAVALTGVLVGLSALIDPAFYASVLYAATRAHRAETVLVMALWTLTSHSLLVVLGVAALLGAYEPVHRLVDAARTRWGAQFSRALGLALVAAGAALVLWSADRLLLHHH